MGEMRGVRGRHVVDAAQTGHILAPSRSPLSCASFPVL